MSKTISSLASILGLTVQGDLGGWTFYTSKRGKIVFYPQAPPLNPPTIYQQLLRQDFRYAGLLWQSITPQSRANWQAAARRARLVITGYNVFTSWCITNDTTIIRTIEAQTGIALVDKDGQPI